MEMTALRSAWSRFSVWQTVTAHVRRDATTIHSRNIRPPKEIGCIALATPMVAKVMTLLRRWSRFCARGSLVWSAVASDLAL